MICKKYLLVCAFAVAGIVHAREFAIDRMPVSPFADAEVSANMTINVANIRYAQQQVKRVNVTGTNASAFGGLVSERPPAWLWRREWNLMRVTRRGTEPPSDWLEYKSGHYGFSLRLR